MWLQKYLKSLSGKYFCNSRNKDKLFQNGLEMVLEIFIGFKKALEKLSRSKLFLLTVI